MRRMAQEMVHLSPLLPLAAVRSCFVSMQSFFVMQGGLVPEVPGAKPERPASLPKTVNILPCTGCCESY